MSTIGEPCAAIQTTTDGFYSPLLGQRDIRLLEVLPGDDSDIVVASLVTVSLDSKPTYAALSYAWGDATQTSMIECNGTSISITTSLAEALKAFRSFSAGPDAPLKRFRRIWADQLCINQHDVLERNHQVGIMGSVYSMAACAFIWLGPGNEDSDRALSFMDVLQKNFLEYVTGDDGDDLFNNLDLPDNVISPSDGQNLVKFYALFSRPWFHRSWTFQEPILAPKRMIACGSQIRDWITVVLAVYRYLHLKGRERITIFSALPLMIIHNCLAEKPEDRRLSRLLYETISREASDPRDKVYALYGLVQAYQEVPLEIDYAMSVEDVYRSTVRSCIKNEGSLSILTHVPLFRNQSNLPSWVPDWRYRSHKRITPVGDGDVYDAPGAGFDASSTARALLVPSPSKDKLILKGFLLAIVHSTIDTAALRVKAADSSPETWTTNAAAAGVPVRFLQGITFQTSYDQMITNEKSPFHHKSSKGMARVSWPHSIEWLAAGSQTPIPQAVWREHMLVVEDRTDGRRLILTKDSLGLAPEWTQVGDRVCILLGGNVPFILRPRQDTTRTTPNKEAKPRSQSTSKTTLQGIRKPTLQGSRRSARVAKQALEATEWTLIGDCYLHGYMHGEAMRTVTEADYVNFILV